MASVEENWYTSGDSDIANIIPSGARLYSGSIDIFRRPRRRPEVGLKTPISPQWFTGSVRLTGMKALVITKQQCTNCTCSLRETDATLRYSQNTDFFRTVGTTAYDSSTCDQPTAEKLQLYHKTSTLFALANSSLHQ